MPFLAGPPRLAARAVKAAGCAFMGAERTALTGEADGLGAGFGRKGREGKPRELFEGDSRSVCFAADRIAQVLQSRNCPRFNFVSLRRKRATEERQVVCA